MYKLIAVCHRLSRLSSKYTCSVHSLCGHVEYTPEVADSLQNNRPVVALESTIITHGMEYPQNLGTAKIVEEIVKSNDAVPATIGIIDGKIHIGLTDDKLELLASKQDNFIKISRRDLPFALSKKLTGGTTVSAAMALAYRAGIETFVTGGIGGVHRGADKSMDISADLTELSKTPITVISAGVKSILDIGSTLEFLETQGVCVATFGKTKQFPAFFTSNSGYDAPHNVETVKEAASLIVARNAIALESGILIAVPIPLTDEADGAEVEAAITEALGEARSKGVKGKDVTPYVLKRVKELTKGASSRANIALIKHNAHVGSLIAVEVSKANHGAKPGQSSRGNALKAMFLPKCTSNSVVYTSAPRSPQDSRRPVVIGGSILDLGISALHQGIKLDGSTQDGKIESAAGGVGRNIADCLARLGFDPLFISAMGPDANAHAMLSKMKHMDTSGISIIDGARTSVCAVLLDEERECLCYIGDMDIHNNITPEQVLKHESAIRGSPMVVVDGNIPVSTMNCVFTVCSENNVPVWFEPTDVSKAMLPMQCTKWAEAMCYASPNLMELRVMHDAWAGLDCHSRNQNVNLQSSGPEDVIKKCLELGVPLVQYIPTLIITLGRLGVLVISKASINHVINRDASAIRNKSTIHAVYYRPPKPSKIASVSGAGDCFACGMIGGIIHGWNLEQCVRAGQCAALLSLSSDEAVPSNISSTLVYDSPNVKFDDPVYIDINAF